MAPTVVTTEIARPPRDVFPYVTDPGRFGEWQEKVVGGECVAPSGSVGVGSRTLCTRRIGLAKRTTAADITRFNPPRTWAVHGIDGPIRALVDVDVEPLDDGSRSRVTIAVDFEGHGIGKLLVPLVVRRQARKEMPANVKRLKERLENTPQS
jgi:Polyketide cyclase / dehydrase and lipid transport